MGQFLWPDWKPLPVQSDPDADAAPPPADPEQAIADNTRAEEALNQFIEAIERLLDRRKKINNRWIAGGK